MFGMKILNCGSDFSFGVFENVDIPRNGQCSRNYNRYAVSETTKILMLRPYGPRFKFLFGINVSLFGKMFVS